jgi:SAM-dependent methyltransferase
VTVKDLVRPLPGVRRLSLMRQRFGFKGSAAYWEQNYTDGGTSGEGSYGVLARAKAEFLNAFVREHEVKSVIEFGCGDGNQLSLVSYGSYVGLDVSAAAIERCMSLFSGDESKSFFLYDGRYFRDRAQLFSADLAISLDVIYHLVEDVVFEAYMSHLFAAGGRYVVVYSSNELVQRTAPHVRHRQFTAWIDSHCPHWRLVHAETGPGSWPGKADFYVYARIVEKNV